MVTGTSDARSLFVASNADGMEERRVEVALGFGVDAVTFDPAGRVHVVAVVVVYSNVGNFASACVTEEEEVAGAA